MRIMHQLPIVAILLGALAVAGCSSSSDVGSGTTASNNTANAGGTSNRAAQLDESVDRTLAALYEKVPGSATAARQAKGILVFPSVVKGAAGVGGDFGRGALRVNGRTAGYYQTLAASFGFQLGGQSRSVVYMFMTEPALRDFENSNGWQVGGSASVTLISAGANLEVNSDTLRQPVLAFVFGNTGLMYDASVQGAKVTRISL